MTSRWRAWAGTLVAAVLLVWLVLRMENRQALADAMLSALQKPAHLLGGFLLFGTGLACGALRWWYLLRTLELPVSGRDVMRLYAIGHFFNGLIPGATGGDLVKATFAARNCPGRKTEAVASIVAERVIGMVALCLLAAGAALAFPAFYNSSPELRIIRRFSLTAGAATIVGLILLLSVNWPAFLAKRENSARRMLVTTLARLYSAIRLCALRPAVLAKTLALSMANHLVMVVCAALLGDSLGMPLHLQEYLATIPVINAVAAVPLTPGGAGIRETAAVFILQEAGAPAAEATALSLLLYGLLLVWAAIGGIMYVLLRKQLPRPE